MNRMRICAWLGLVARVAGQGPIQIPFSAQTFGEDGPWPAVELAVGTKGTNVHLLPGGWFEADIYSPKACGFSYNPTTCPAAKAGLYEPHDSDAPVMPGQVNKTGFVDQWNAGPETNKTGSGSLMLDRFAFSSTSGRQFVVPQASISLMESVTVTLPSGKGYMPSIGFLGLGAPTDNANYTLTNGSQATLNLIPGYLHSQSITSSNSFGLHYGSVAMGQPASLTFGGYDQSRIVGDVGVYKTSGVGGGEPVVDVVDVTLGVIEGSSPFNSTNIGSLYRPADTRNTSTPMSLNPTVPYMQLPLGTCEAVAEYLPVTLNSDLDLYVWNVEDPRYSKIVNSGAYLGFSLVQPGKDDLVIKIPFSLLNLTLTAPLVDNPTPYFPCKPSYSTDGRYYLGRAFLQGAYLAINWHQGTFFVAQATGPDCAQPNLLSFSPEDVTMKSLDSSQFTSTWAKYWSDVAQDAGVMAHYSGGNWRATAAKVGISVGSALGVGLVALGIYLVIRHRRRCRKAESQLHEWYGGSEAGWKHRRLPSQDGTDCMNSPLPQYPGPPPATMAGEMEGSQTFIETHQAELGANPHILEMQARSVSIVPPMSQPGTPVEIHGNEVGILPVSLGFSGVPQNRRSDALSDYGPSSISPNSKRRSSDRSSSLRKSTISSPLETRRALV